MRSEGGEGVVGGVGGVRPFRAMIIFHNTHAGLKIGSVRQRCPFLHFLVYHSVRRSLLGRDAVRRPRPSTRARRGFFAANQRRRLCNDWPLVAAVLLVLSLIVARARAENSKMSLARLWRDQRKPQEARDLLAPAYGRFAEDSTARSEEGEGTAGKVSDATVC